MQSGQPQEEQQGGAPLYRRACDRAHLTASCELRRVQGSGSQQQLSSQLEALQLTQDEGAQNVQFNDLSKAWLRVLITQYLKPAERLALFRTCMGMAVAVAKSSSRLALQLRPHTRQQGGSHAAALRIAANCSNICMTLLSSYTTEDVVVSLDEAAVWPCIKQLTLLSVPLDQQAISALHMKQLEQLHTIQLGSHVDVCALQQTVQAGGLHALRHLCLCEGLDCSEVEIILQQLGPVLGNKVTQLTLNEDHWPAVRALSSWPALQQLHIKPEAEWGPATLEAWHSGPLKQLFSHSGVKEVVVPAAVLYADRDVNSSMACSLQLLDILGTTSTALLAKLPLYGVQHLKLHGCIHDYDCVSSAAVSNLRKCSKVQVIPGTWDSQAEYFRTSSIPSSTPMLQATYDAELLQWLLPTCGDLHGAMVLHNSNDSDGYADPSADVAATYGNINEGSKALDVAHFYALDLLPAGVHTLALNYGVLAEGCSWVQLMSHIPSHVHFLLMRQCKMSLQDLQGILELPPPSGLRRLYLAQDRENMSFVAQHADTIAEAMSAHWPTVQLELDTEDSYEDAMDDDFFEQYGGDDGVDTDDMTSFW